MADQLTKTVGADGQQMTHKDALLTLGRLEAETKFSASLDTKDKKSIQSDNDGMNFGSNRMLGENVARYFKNLGREDYLSDTKAFLAENYFVTPSGRYVNVITAAQLGVNESQYGIINKVAGDALQLATFEATAGQTVFKRLDNLDFIVDDGSLLDTRTKKEMTSLNPDNYELVIDAENNSVRFISRQGGWSDYTPATIEYIDKNGIKRVGWMEVPLNKVQELVKKEIFDGKLKVAEAAAIENEIKVKDELRRQEMFGLLGQQTMNP